MAGLGNRRAVIKRQVNGGTTAPPSAGPRTGLGQAHPVFKPKTGVGQARALPPAPAAAPQPAPAPPQMPWNVQAANDIAGAGAKRDNTIAGLNSSWQIAQQNFGLDPGYNDVASNPYSQAAQLQRNYENARRGSTNSLAAAGQLYAGSLVNAQNANALGYNQNRSSLQNQRDKAFADYQAGITGAGDTYNQSVNSANWNAINAQLAQPVEPQTSPAPTAKKPQTKRQKQIKQNIAVGKGHKAR